MYYDGNVQGKKVCMQLGGKELKAGKGSSPPNAGVGQVEQSLLMLERGRLKFAMVLGGKGSH